VCIGFLPHNFYPARIFMGDTGAMLLGLLLAYAPISSLSSLDPNSLTNTAAHGGGVPNRFPEVLPLLLPAAILLIPYTDLVLAVIRRMRAGQSPFAADRKHLHHRLLDTGHSQRASVMIMYLWATLFSGTVVLLSVMRTRLLVLAAVTVVAVLVLLLATMPRLRPWTRRGRFRAPAPAIGRPRSAAVLGHAVPDRAVPDRAVPDRAVPDRAVPDRAVPDRAVPEPVPPPGFPATGPVPPPGFPATGPVREAGPAVSEWQHR
jgi:UDP-GlcNAc:undecaprenyl-phosphate/decaprenyl-phosphate GlcNAc-1-phosphate transferase